MYISKLHLQGFKSFLNKTNLEFGEGVTAVVGPNGCGKSNIVDAIRWILGEQKISALRSAKKEDVIFSGTKNRKPLSFCEASMLIHNNRGMLPIEYNDVEISRRLFRSGESEFFINRTPCRLKDIHNLFVDTGMSSNAYSVIELKMVDTILSHNAGDRRHMFEEAAGINHYKQQRQSALRKMDATRVDMERVNDIILEVNSNIKNLNLQMKRFQRYEKLVERLKTLHIETAQAEIHHIQSKQAPLNEKLNQVKSNQASLSGQMNIDETLEEQTKVKFEEKKQGLSSCQQELSDLENKIATMNSQLLVWSEKVAGNENQKLHFNDELQQNEKGLSLSKSKILDLKTQLEGIVPEMKKRQKEFKQIERSYYKVTKEYNQLCLNQEELKRQAEIHLLKIRGDESTLEHLKSTIKEKENYLEKLQEGLDNYEEKYLHSQAEINLIRAEVEKQEKENNSHSITVNGLKTEHLNLENKILKLKDEMSQTQFKQQSLQSQIQFYKNMIANKEGLPKGIKEVLNNKEQFPFVLGMLANLIEVQESYNLAVETALGEFNHYLIVDSRKNALKLITDTQYKLSIIALDSIPEVPSDNRTYPGESLLSFVTCDSKIKELLKILIGNVCLLPEGQIEPDTDKFTHCDWVGNTGKYFSQGFIIKRWNSGSVSLISQQQKLEELNKDSQRVEKQLQKLKVNLEAEINKADITYKELEKITGKLDAGIIMLNAKEQKLSQQDFVTIRHKESIAENKEQIKDTNTQLINLNRQVKSIKDEIHNLQSDYDSLSKQQTEFQIKIDDGRKKQNNCQQILQETKLKLVEIEKEREGIEFRIDTSKIQIKEIKYRMEKYKSELSRINKESQELKSSITEGKTKLINYSEGLELTAKGKVELENEYNNAYTELQRLQSGIRDRQKRKDEYINKIREYEIQIAEGESEIKRHRNRIHELYQEDIADIPSISENFNIIEKKGEIETIQSSIDRIGPVNMAVAEEYENESERYQFLTEQFSDLEDSERTLEETINKLDSEAQTQFLEAFNAIKENFSKTYSSFFNGGEGHLRLIGEDDPLEAEIEIIARPPGKKTQTLRMLSAGEKALTAIALLFAIYLVKPSPFCILDEVDAPLDDTNINKFTKVLKEFSTKTQFIVVTHNKLTMEKADYMYGITQQEEGVSKIVSVKFKHKKMKRVAT